MSTTALRAAIAQMAHVWDRAGNGLLSADDLRKDLNRAAVPFLREAEHIYYPTIVRILAEHGLDQELHPLDIREWNYLP